MRQREGPLEQRTLRLCEIDAGTTPRRKTAKFGLNFLLLGAKGITGEWTNDGGIVNTHLGDKEKMKWEDRKGGTFVGTVWFCWLEAAGGGQFDGLKQQIQINDEGPAHLQRILGIAPPPPHSLLMGLGWAIAIGPMNRTDTRHANWVPISRQNEISKSARQSICCLAPNKKKKRNKVTKERNRDKLKRNWTEGEKEGQTNMDKWAQHDTNWAKKEQVRHETCFFSHIIIFLKNY